MKIQPNSISTNSFKWASIWQYKEIASALRPIFTTNIKALSTCPHILTFISYGFVGLLWLFLNLSFFFSSWGGPPPFSYPILKLHNSFNQTAVISIPGWCITCNSIGLYCSLQFSLNHCISWLCAQKYVSLALLC